MKSGQFIVFTSGAGQYYYIESICLCLKDVTEDLLLVDGKSCLNKRVEKEQIRSIVNNLVNLGYVKDVRFGEINYDYTRFGLVKMYGQTDRHYSKPRELAHTYIDVTQDDTNFDEDVVDD